MSNGTENDQSASFSVGIVIHIDYDNYRCVVGPISIRPSSFFFLLLQRWPPSWQPHLHTNDVIESVLCHRMARFYWPWWSFWFRLGPNHLVGFNATKRVAYGGDRSSFPFQFTTCDNQSKRVAARKASYAGIMQRSYGTRRDAGR